MKIIKLSATTSTNSYLKELIKESPSTDAMVVWAESQSAGRGQRGAGWSSSEGESLTFSVFGKFSEGFRPELSALNFAVSLGLISALKAFEIPELMVKWPNDILSDKRKMCGILIENQWQGDKPVSFIIGIGLNVNETEFENLPKATSMKISGKKTFDRKEVLEKILQEIELQISRIEKSSIENLIKAYEQFLFRKNKISVFETSDHVRFNGIIQGVSVDGQLQVQLENEVIKNYEVKEIKLIY